MTTLAKTILPTKTTVQVSAKHIEHARCGDPRSCMVRVATYEHFKKALGLPVYAVRVKGNGITVTLQHPNGSRETTWWLVPTHCYNKILLFDAAGPAIAAAPQNKMAILKAMGVRPFGFNADYVKSRMKKPFSDERLATILANRNKLQAYWARREKREPGVTPPGYLPGVRKRYSGSAMLSDKQAKHIVDQAVKTVAA
jgi:hypothetical protein